MTRSPLFGVLLAMCGALLLSPDTLLMRLSGLDGGAMLAWRGGCMAVVLLAIWAITSTGRRRDLALLFSGAGLAVAVCQFVNAAAFSLTIAVAPVSVVLFGVAAVPVCAAVFARLILGEPTSRATWITIAAVIAGIGIAVFPEGGSPGFEPATLIGALGGLTVAATLSLSFVLLRAHGALPILLTIGAGAALSGLSGVLIAGPGALSDGHLLPIAVSGLVLLPGSFVMLSVASRFTHAANVSLMLLLETVLGPLFVWVGVSEMPTTPMFLGGAIVIVSLAIYLLHTRQTARRRIAAA